MPPHHLGYNPPEKAKDTHHEEEKWGGSSVCYMQFEILISGDTFLGLLMYKSKYLGGKYRGKKDKQRYVPKTGSSGG